MEGGQALAKTDCHCVGHLLACPEFGRGSTDRILCFPLEGSKGDTLRKKFSGVFQLTSTVNKSVKPLLILTGCFSEKGLPRPRWEVWWKKEHKWYSEVFVTSKTDTPLIAGRQSFLSLIWSQTDCSNNISYNCCCQCLKPAGAPSLSIFCPCILQIHGHNHCHANRLRVRPARLQHTATSGINTFNEQ